VSASGRRGSQDDQWRRDQKLALVVLADPEDVEAGLVRVLDCVRAALACGRRELMASGFVEAGGKTIDSDFHI
jgi:hypothetical protein